MRNIGRTIRLPASAKKPMRALVAVGASLLIAVLALVYLGLTNDVATQGYRLHDLQNSIAKLEAQQSSLQVQIAAAQSLQRVAAEVPFLALIPIQSTEYLTSLTTAVAVR